MKKRSDKTSFPKAAKGTNSRVEKQDRTIAKVEQALDSILLPGETPLGQHEAETLPILMGYDGSDLARAKAHWLFGEWQALAEIDIDRLKQHPDRARLALLAAAARQQIGRHDSAKYSAKMALKWGCSPRLVARVLVASVHNTLGRASALLKDEVRSLRHFRDSVQVGQPSSDATESITHNRFVRELTKLGLLPQAAKLVEQDYANVKVQTERPVQSQARLKMLESEIELVRGGLIQATMRGQLYRSDDTGAGAMSNTGPQGECDEICRHKRLQQASPSQLGQDLWVLERTGYKRNGFFVEFGAGDGVFLSNTYLLEKEFGWQGICAEPNPKFLDQLRRNRNCIVTDACIAAETGKRVDFVMAGEFGGMLQHAAGDSHGEKRLAYKDLGRVIQVTTVSLDDFLRNNNAPCEIDYLSIDTEGSEFEILSTFPFHKWRIHLLTVEHNYMENRGEIRALLESHGYGSIEVQWDDWYFLK